MTVSMTVGAEALPTPPVPEAFKVSVREALGPALWLCVWFSLLTNLLMLVSPIYMLQIYDRVLVSGSSDTLIWLSIIAVALEFRSSLLHSGSRKRIFNRSTRPVLREIKFEPKKVMSAAMMIGSKQE